MAERHDQAKLVKLFQSVGAKVFNVHGHMMQESGWPDLQVYHWQGNFHVEVKTMKGKLKPHQLIMIKELSIRRFPVYVARRNDSGLWFFDSWIVGEHWEVREWDGKDVVRMISVLGKWRFGNEG